MKLRGSIVLHPLLLWLSRLELYPEVQGLDAVRHYVKLHNLNTRKQTPSLRYARLTGRAAVPSRSAPASIAGDAGEEGQKKK